MGSLGLGLGGIKLNPNAQLAIYRPPQWGPNGRQPLMLIVPAPQGNPQYAASQGAPGIVPSGTYVFDAVLRAQHEQRFTKTKHPVQTGANISDHIYVEPARLTLEIGMSDAMDSYAPDMWQGSASKSVSAYQTLLAIGFARVPLTLVTRLRTYYNMALVSIPAEETVRSFGGLRAVIEFEQIFVASTSTSSVQTTSQRTQTTDSTNLGTVTPQQPTATEENQYNVMDFNTTGGDQGTDIIHTGAFASQSGPNFNAGNWSSVNVNSLNQPVSNP